MKEKLVLCNKCGRMIESREDLVTAVNFVFVEPYHTKCYSRGVKSLNTVFLSNTPINGFMGNVSAVFSAILSFGFLFSSDMRIFSLIFFIPVLLRALSYFNYERYLK
ncbi:MAG: hypothetical protein JW702_02010 [Clostridiales bacterium]|nr:hypothetical protein [Clostridiales bacterium]